jgi:Domain of unknown function (DUF4838)
VEHSAPAEATPASPKPWLTALATRRLNPGWNSRFNVSSIVLPPLRRVVRQAGRRVSNTPMAVELELERGCRLSRDLSAPEAALAAAELEAALGRAVDDGVEIVLSHGEAAGERFRRRVAPGRLELHGESPRGLLFGAYATLEELGAGWPWPTEPATGAARASLEEEVEDAPALPSRCLVLGERALVEDVESWIIWAARRRLNCLFVHVSTERAPLGAAPEAAWLARRDRAVALAHERGLTIEHGGHLLPELLPGDAVRAIGSGRAPGVAARRAIEEHVRAHPEAEVLHLWGADLPPGARGREASEAALRTANAVAEVVEDIRPGAQVAFLAYHDTEEVPRGVRPRHNVCLLFAPRERCYDHPLVDPGCRRNAHYRELFRAHVEHFAAAGAAPPRVFEYWFDAILFARGVPDLSRTMREDLAFYGEAGAHTVQMLITGHGRRPPPHPNPPAFARLAWDPRSEVLS